MIKTISAFFLILSLAFDLRGAQGKPLLNENTKSLEALLLEADSRFCEYPGPSLQRFSDYGLVAFFECDKKESNGNTSESVDVAFFLIDKTGAKILSRGNLDFEKVVEQGIVSSVQVEPQEFVIGVNKKAYALTITTEYHSTSINESATQTFLIEKETEDNVRRLLVVDGRASIKPIKSSKAYFDLMVKAGKKAKKMSFKEDHYK